MSTPIPVNAAQFSLSEVLEATGGALVGAQAALAEAGAVARGVVTDSRAEVGGALFVALKGERFDAHRFLADVAARGATLALVEDPNLGLVGQLTQVQVPCTLTALGDLARWHRRRWGGLVVAVAGSAGKTTTKGCVAGALEAVIPGGIHAARGNLNNRVGAPMVLLGVTEAHQVAVLELGTNLRGEVAELTRICEPDVGVLTLIDFEHTEGIGDLDAIEAEEGDLLRGLRQDGVALGNADDPRVLRQLRAATHCTTLEYGGGETARYRLVSREAQGLSGARLVVQRPSLRSGSPRGAVQLAAQASCSLQELDSPLIGYPGALASVAALAVSDVVSHRLGRPPPSVAEVSQALARAAVAESGRLSPKLMLDGGLVLDDSYNSNPGSVLSSLSVARELAAARGARLVAVLGEMLELGSLSRREHRRVGQALGEYGLSRLVAVRGDAALLVDEAAKLNIPAEFYETAEAALERCLTAVQPGDVILVKGSRGVKLERVVEGLTARSARDNQEAPLERPPTVRRP